MSPSIRNERGSIIILMTVFLLLLLGFVALGIEGGRGGGAGRCGVGRLGRGGPAHPGDRRRARLEIGRAHV